MNFDAIEIPCPKQVIDYGQAGGGNQAAALEVGSDPVTDLDLSVRPINLARAHGSGELVLVPNPGCKAFLSGELLHRGPDKIARILDFGRGIHPGEPFAKIDAFAIDHFKHHWRISFFQEHKQHALTDLLLEHASFLEVRAT
jgi:hypothetical protein